MPRELTRRRFIGKTTVTLGSVLGLATTNSVRGESKAPREFQGKFAICNETFRDWPFDRAFALAAECGYQGIEIAPFTISNDVREISSRRRKEIRRIAETNRLKIAGLHWLLAKTKGFHLTSPDGEVRRRTAGYLGDLARFCADLGGDLLIFGSPQQRNLASGVSREQGLQHAAEVLREALPVLERAGVKIALEPLSPRTTNFLQTAAEAVELIRLVDSSSCRLILDCNAMSSESKSIPDLLRKHRSYLVHFHANDPNSQGPGFGKLDFVPIFQALREIEYGGWISVEVFDYQPGPERLARESISYMKKCLARSG